MGCYNEVNEIIYEHITVLSENKLYQHPRHRENGTKPCLGIGMATVAKLDLAKHFDTFDVNSLESQNFSEGASLMPDLLPTPIFYNTRKLSPQ